jgi:hypothetical protein
MKKRQLIRLTECDLRRIIKESVQRILNEGDMFDEYGNDLEGGNNGDEYFQWAIYCNDHKMAVSSDIFSTIDEAAKDCENHFEETNFYLLCNKLNDEEDDERVCALVYNCGPNGETDQDCYNDAFLINTGFGWVD